MAVLDHDEVAGAIDTYVDCDSDSDNRTTTAGAGGKRMGEHKESTHHKGDPTRTTMSVDSKDLPKRKASVTEIKCSRNCNSPIIWKH